MIRWFLISGQAYALYELIRRRLWDVMPVFAFYVPVAFLVTITRAHPADIWYARNIWAPLEMLAIGLMIGSAIEAFVSQNEDRVSECGWLLILFGVIVLAAAPMIYRSDVRWLATFIQFRTIISIVIGAFLGIDLAMIEFRRWHLPGSEYRHLIALTGIFGSKAIASAAYLAGGEWDIPVNGWLYRSIDGATMASAGLFYFLWAWWKHRAPLIKRPGPAVRARRGIRLLPFPGSRRT